MEPVLEERIGILDPVDVADEGILIGVQPLIKEGCLNNTVIEDVREGYDDQDEAASFINETMLSFWRSVPPFLRFFEIRFVPGFLIWSFLLLFISLSLLSL